MAFMSTIFVFIISSCGSDDDKKVELKNEVSVNGKTFKFTAAHIESFLEEEDQDLGEFSAHSFSLTGDGLEIDNEGNFSGTGDYLSFTLLSENTTSLEVGTYKLGYNTDAGDAYEFFIYEDLTQFSYGDYYEAVNGTIEVSKSNDVYTLTFDFDVYIIETEEVEAEYRSERMIGNYKGAVEVIESNEEPGKSHQRELFKRRMIQWL